VKLMPARPRLDDQGDLTVFGKSQNPWQAWREQRVIMLACLRSVHTQAHAYELDDERSPSHGGPPV
jgi:hypothetical protein